MNKQIEDYLLESIRNYYKTFDRAHDERHFDEVYNGVNKLIKFEFHHDDMKELIGYISAAYHDTGRMINDKYHEKYSVNILNHDLRLKKLIIDAYDEDTYKDIISKCEDMIASHRSSVKTIDEMCLILKDADKLSHLNKERGLYRPCAYYLDRQCKNESLEESVKNRMLYIKGRINFTAKSHAGKLLYGTDKITIPVTEEEIRNMIIYLKNEK